MNDHQNEAHDATRDAACNRTTEAEHLQVILAHTLQRLSRIGADDVARDAILAHVNVMDAGAATMLLGASIDRIAGLDATAALREVLEFRILLLDQARRGAYMPDAVAALRATLSAHRAMLPDGDPGLGSTVRWLIGALAAEIDQRITDPKARAAFVVSTQQRLIEAIGEAGWRQRSDAKRAEAVR